MYKELQKNDVLNLLYVWRNWMCGPDPANNTPVEFEKWVNSGSHNLKICFGISLHSFLWLLIKIGSALGIPSLMVWAANTRIEYDHLYFEPRSCGYTNSYTNMGLGYLKMGKIDEAIECLDKSWRVYPCPHNTSYGLNLKLYKKLKKIPKANDAVSEYAEMWEYFRTAMTQPLSSGDNQGKAF